ncbi:CPBP family intramembrane glutamic endopeptidase [Nocardia transvalensis]|uniref:CPBP family intramembrane glutamic endopeptidase n=1 Tax=Nocardia transvalensis TaxID=37333 RepID=UPI001894EDD6|nr:CPBP family intramembrane glutamic endopeptidase [Nocardia transvalensis]MBF6333039.1 CPBP family intramembrane metalloprotease [Nocardia transvalensis]
MTVAPWRRAAVAGITAVGAGLLHKSLSARPDSRAFYGLSLATAATWTAGGIVLAPPRLGSRSAALLAPPIGAGAFGVFYGCALVARRIPLLNRAISDVLRYAGQAPTTRALLIALVSGAGEELFFRGPVYDVAGDHPVAVSTGVYCLTTTATRNPALTLASAVMGTLFGLQRRASGGVAAPVLTHLTWSTLMIRYLPALFPAAERPRRGRITAV